MDIPASLPAIVINATNLENKWVLVTERVNSHFLSFLPTDHVATCVDALRLQPLLAGNHPTIQLVLYSPELSPVIQHLISLFPADAEHSATCLVCFGGQIPLAA